MQSSTNREEMMWLSAHLYPTFVCNRYASSQTSALHDKPRRFSGIKAHVLHPPTASENYHQLTFEARYVTVLVEVEQSGDPRWRASAATPHSHSSLSAASADGVVDKQMWWKVCGLPRPDAACGCCSRWCACRPHELQWKQSLSAGIAGIY